MFNRTPKTPEEAKIDEILREEEQALLNQKGRQLEIEPSSEDVLVEGSIEEQIQQPEKEVQDIQSLIAAGNIDAAREKAKSSYVPELSERDDITKEELSARLDQIKISIGNHQKLNA